MNKPKQIPFDFEHRPALAGEDFLVAGPNREAIGWLDSWPEWPGPLLVITGPAGSGKSHLANVFAGASGALDVTAAGLREKGAARVLDDARERGARALIIDDGEGFIAAGLEEELLHLYNMVREAGLHILMTASTPPARWGISLKDLSSRLNTAPLAEIGQPDDTLLGALLVKQFADRQLEIDAGELSYLMSRIERSFAAVRDVVARADHLALSEKRPLSVHLLRRVLEDE